MTTSMASMVAALTVAALSLAAQACVPSDSGIVLAQDPDDARAAGERGVPVSASAPSFMPYHATGPNAGGRACPLCTYGLGPQFQLWMEEARLTSALPLIELLEAEAREAPEKPERKQDGFVPYLVIAASNGRNLAARSIEAVESLRLQRLFVTVVPSWDDVETSALYGHSMRDRPGTRGYLVINRRVFQRWENPTEKDWPTIAEALRRGRPFVTSYDLSDAQIAPQWEPGQRLIVRFRVVDSKGAPSARTKVSTYQTDRDGAYNPRGWNRRQPRLSTVAWTDRDGWITFDTIMPGPYPDASEPAHIHFSASVNGKAAFRTLWFEGDPLLTEERRQWADRDQETLVIPLDRSSDPWRAEHTFVIETARGLTRAAAVPPAGW